MKSVYSFIYLGCWIDTNGSRLDDMARGIELSVVNWTANNTNLGIATRLHLT